MRARSVIAFIAILVFWTSCISFAGRAQTVATKSDQVSLGAVIWIPVVLNTAPNGLHHYEFRVFLDALEIAEIEAVRFHEALRSFATFEITPDGNSVRVRVDDQDDVLAPGATNIKLAEVKIRGTFGGRTGVNITVIELMDDRLNRFNVAVSNGQLQVAMGADTPQLVVGVDGTLVGDTVEIPIILTLIVSGLESYRLTVRLEQRDVATFLGAQFPFFAGQEEVQISPDGDEITVTARDVAGVIEAGARGTILVWLKLKGDLPTVEGSALRILSNNITEDNDNSGPFPTQNGLITVIRIENLPPEFFGPQPRPQERIGDPSPLLSIVVNDDKKEVMPDSIRLAVQDSLKKLEFGWQSRGAQWDPTSGRFTVDLKALGVRLSGDVKLHIRARDRQGAEGRFEWSFTVVSDHTPPPKTIEELLDADRDNRLSDIEILQALDYWTKGRELASGLKIDDFKMLALLDKWIKGAPLRASAM